MPELPEVETYIRGLAPLLHGKCIVGAHVYWPRIVAVPEDVEAFTTLIQGRCFAHFDRRGKYMLFGLDSGETLIVHLRMTGELRVHAAEQPRDKHTHLVLALDSGERLHYRDQRKFGRVWLVDNPDRVLAKLGPEPLSSDFTPALLVGALKNRVAAVKALLLDQSIVAGVGNIYADEALFRAGIDPRRAGGDLKDAEIERLWQSVRAVLQMGIELRGSSLGSGPQNYTPPDGEPGAAQASHQVFRRTGLPCTVCGAPVERVVLAQRSTHFCPHCQR
ncbi:MAG: bifunctional DNA-formamidopyrimidine glycosylase/DNA-(apurinic or apyrimidinic site) lyase [Caldilineaceae bacterium]